jgi:hypothetical protein
MKRLLTLNLARPKISSINMPSEKQIAANRRNATKSTGPRSSAGKKRASRNAYRHGLSLPITASATLGQELENLAREIAAESDGAVTLERARTVVEPELDRARMRRLKITLIEQTLALGGVGAVPATSNSDPQVIRVLKACGRGILTVPVAAPMTGEETEGWAKAMRRALPVLVKIERYERRVAARQERAIRALSR